MPQPRCCPSAASGLPAPTAEADVPVRAEEQHVASWAVGEGGEGLEEGWVSAHGGGFGPNAIEFTVAAEEGGEEAEDCGVDIHSIFRT